VRWLALALTFACSDPVVAPPREAPPPDEPPPEVEVPAPDRPPMIVDAPEGGCAFDTPVRVWEGEGWASIAAHDGFVIGGTAGTPEVAFQTRLALDGTITPIARALVDPPLPTGRRLAAPALAASPAGVAMVLVFGDRTLRLAGAGDFVWHEIGEGASERFSPALHYDGEGWLIAWTDERESPVRVRSARVGDPHPSHEIRPSSGNGTAPAFVQGAPAELVFFDAREGMSVAHRVRFDDGALGEIEVAQPVNLIASPPELAAVRIGDSLWLGYTAIGSMATTAVGLVQAGTETPPTPLVRGTGYGTLHVHAASLGQSRAVFVADAPQGSTRDAPRELHVRIVDSNGAGEPAILRGPSGGASRGRIAHAGGGQVAVSFTDRDGIYAALGRCALE
jgi:hypothetical protein